MTTRELEVFERIASALERIAYALEPERRDDPHELTLYDRISNIDCNLDPDNKVKA